MRRGLQQISGLKEFLHGKDTDGQSGFDKVKGLFGDDNTDLYRSLSYLENTLQVDLEVSGKLDRDYQPAWQVTDTAATSPWEAYARQQLANTKMLKTEEEKIDCIAKAAVGKFMHALPVLKAEPGTEPGPEESLLQRMRYRRPFFPVCLCSQMIFWLMEDRKKYRIRGSNCNVHAGYEYYFL